MQEDRYLIYTVISGSMTSSVTNKKYFILFLDDYRHYCITYLLSHKSDGFLILENFIAEPEARFSSKIVGYHLTVSKTVIGVGSFSNSLVDVVLATE